jgi:hypothetical protein
MLPEIFLVRSYGMPLEMFGKQKVGLLFIRFFWNFYGEKTPRMLMRGFMHVHNVA